MKVKKLLTLLLVSAAMSACSLNGAGSESSGSSANSQSSPSSDVTSSSDAGSSNSSDSSDSSSSSSSSSSSAAPTLASIAVTANPTKANYDTDDTALDLAGLVVTATMSDGSTSAVTDYQVSDVDFSTPGQKTVTVTYQGQTATFQINVAQAKPTAWDADAVALFAANVYGYNVPFFYGPDVGVGDFTWTQGRNGAVYAEGGEVNAAAALDQNALKAVADLFIADGFVASKSIDLENQVYYYVLSKNVEYQSIQRELQVRIAAASGTRLGAAQGQFYIDIMDPYIYSWADLGLEELLQAYFQTTEDIPDLPAGAKFSKADYSNYTMAYMQYGMSYVNLYVICDGNYALSIANAYGAAQWSMFQPSEDSYFAISPQESLRVDGTYDEDDGELTLKFSVPAAYPENVVTVAGLLGVSKYEFTKYSNTIYYVQDETELQGEEADLEDLFLRFDALLTAGNVLTQKGSVQAGEDSISANYFNEEKKLKVSLEVTSELDEENNVVYEYGIVVSEFVEIPAIVKDICEAIEESEYDFTSDPDGDWYAQFPLPVNTSDDDIKYYLSYYAYCLVNAENIEDPFEAIGQIDSDGRGGFYIDLANQTKKVEFWVYKTTENDVVTAITLQISIGDYQVPQSALKDALAAKLGITFKWSQSDQNFWFNGTVTFGEGESYKDVVNAFENALLEVSEDAEELSNDSSSNYYVSVWYCPEGYFDFQCWEQNGVVKTLVSFTMYDQSIPLQVNVIGTQLGARVENNNGQYQALVDTFYYYRYYYTEGYTAAQLAQIGDIIIGSVGSTLIGFALQGTIGFDANNILTGTYFNETTGMTVVLTMPYDENEETIGVLATIIPPQAPQA